MKKWICLFLVFASVACSQNSEVRPSQPTPVQNKNTPPEQSQSPKDEADLPTEKEEPSEPQKNPMAKGSVNPSAKAAPTGKKEPAQNPAPMVPAEPQQQAPPQAPVVDDSQKFVVEIAKFTSSLDHSCFDFSCMLFALDRQAQGMAHPTEAGHWLYTRNFSFGGEALKMQCQEDRIMGTGLWKASCSMTFIPTLSSAGVKVKESPFILDRVFIAEVTDRNVLSKLEMALPTGIISTKEKVNVQHKDGRTLEIARLEMNCAAANPPLPTPFASCQFIGVVKTPNQP